MLQLVAIALLVISLILFVISLIPQLAVTFLLSLAGLVLAGIVTLIGIITGRIKK